MTSDGNEATARRRRIAEKGSDRLALITGGRVSTAAAAAPPNASLHSSNASCPPSLTDEKFFENEGSKVQPVLRKSESTKMESRSESRSSLTKVKHDTSSKMKIYLYKTMSPSQLQPAILASQDTRRKCSFLVGIVTVLSYAGFPILGSYIIRSIILSTPLVLLLFININIIIGPLLLDAMMLIQHGLINPSEEADLPDSLGSPFEWGMLFKAGVSALFMDSCIYSVVVVCAISFLQKLGL